MSQGHTHGVGLGEELAVHISRTEGAVVVGETRFASARPIIAHSVARACVRARVCLGCRLKGCQRVLRLDGQSSSRESGREDKQVKGLRDEPGVNPSAHTVCAPRPRGRARGGGASCTNPHVIQTGPKKTRRITSGAVHSLWATRQAGRMEGGSARVARLREEATRALDGALSTCTPEQFSEGFPGLHEDSAILRHVFLQGQASLRQNALVSCEARSAFPCFLRVVIMQHRATIPPLYSSPSPGGIRRPVQRGWRDRESWPP